MLCDNLEGWDGWEVAESFKKEGTYVYLWLFHVNVWQKPTQYCKAIILQLKINLKRQKIKNKIRGNRKVLNHMGKQCPRWHPVLLAGRNLWTRAQLHYLLSTIVYHVKVLVWMYSAWKSITVIIFFFFLEILFFFLKCIYLPSRFLFHMYRCCFKENVFFCFF